MGSGLLDLAMGGVALLAAVLLAVALLRLGFAAYELAAPQDAEAVPLLRLLALGTGALAGAALIAVAPDPMIFLPPRIFAAEGPWTIGLGELLARHALPRCSRPRAARRPRAGSPSAGSRPAGC